MHGDWFYTTDYGIFGHEVKVTERSPPDNPTGSKGLQEMALKR